MIKNNIYRFLALLLTCAPVPMVLQAQTFKWARSFGGPNFDTGESIAVDASGNVYTTGDFYKTVDFDPGAGTTNLSATGTEFATDIFIQKMDASGNFKWAQSFGGTNFDIGISIAVDASGNVYTMGSFRGTVDFDPGTGTANLTAGGGKDIFILKMDTFGNFQWARSFGAASTESRSMTVDASGNVYTTGNFNGTVDFDPGTGTAETYELTAMGRSPDIFIQKLDTSGNFQWAKSMGGTGFDGGHSITVDASGNVYTTGSFEGTVDFDPGAGTTNLSTSGSDDNDIFVQKLNTSGDFQWARSFGASNNNNDIGRSITVDASGNIYTAGDFSGTADFDPGTGATETYELTSTGRAEVFVQKMDASGDFQWARSFGAALSNDWVRSITVDASGDVYTTGTFQGTVDFDPGTETTYLSAAGDTDTDIFIQKMDASGDFQWAHSFGGPTNNTVDNGFSIIADASGNLYITGDFQGTVDFDPGTGTTNLISQGGGDIFVLKLGTQCGPGQNISQLTGASTTQIAVGTEIGQSVTVSCNGSIEGISTSFSGISTPIEVTLRLYSGDGETTVLATSAASTISADGLARIDFTTPVTVTSGNSYTFGVTYNTVAGGLLSDTNNSYTGGNVYTNSSGAQPPVWTSDLTQDLVFVVHFKDDVAPVAECQDITVQLDANSEASIVAEDVDNGSSDDSGTVSLSVNQSTFDCGDVGTPVDVTLTATDPSGNSESCTAVVTVEDPYKPVFTNIGGTGTVEDPFTSLDPAVIGNATGPHYFSFNGSTFQGVLDNTNGGGWLMVLNYVNMAGDNPELVVRNSDLPLEGASILGNSEAGSSTWGHIGNTLATTIDFEEMRFYGHTSRDPSDIIDFTTSYVNAVNYVKSGTGDFAGINNAANYNLLPSHTASIPQNASDVLSNQGDFALTEFPFWKHGQVHWGIRGLGDRWEVDDYARNTESTIHRVWVRGDLSPAFNNTRITVQLDASGNATVAASDFSITAADNCGTPTLSLSKSTFTCADVGVNTIQLNATDADGNVTSIDVEVTIEQNPAFTGLSNCTDIFTCNNNTVTYTPPTLPSCATFPTVPTTAPTGFTSLGSNGNSTYFISDQPATATDAFIDAQTNGYELVTINSEDENTFLKTELDKLTSSPYPVFIGYNDVASEGNFVWQSGQPNNYTNWASGEPNNFGSGEHYVSMASDGKWSDVGGGVNTTGYVVIEYHNYDAGPILVSGLPSGSIFPPGTTTNKFYAEDTAGNATTCSFDVTLLEEDITAPVLTDCPTDILGCSGTITYTAPSTSDNCSFPDVPTSVAEFTSLGTLGNSTYFISDDTVAASTAFTNAQANGYELVTINSQAENDFIRARANDLGFIDQLLIGINDVATGGDYVWQSGQPVSYTNWDTGEPSNTGGVEDYVGMKSNGLWNDIAEDITNHVVIEYHDYTAGPVLVEGLPSGSTFPFGTTKIEFYVEDAAGNEARCSFDVILDDITNPNISCASDVTQVADAGMSGATVTVTAPGVTDNCGNTLVLGTGVRPYEFSGGTLIDTPAVFSGASAATADVELELTFSGDHNFGTSESFVLTGPDDSTIFNGNDYDPVCVLVTQTITVLQNTWNAWVSTYGSDLTFTLLANANVGEGDCTSGPTNFFQLKVPNSGDIVLSNDRNYSSNASGFYPMGTTTVTWTATDTAGNTATCTQTVTVNMPSTDNAITAFSFMEQTGAATIDNANSTVTIEVANGSDVTALSPTITVSADATIDPASGVSGNFTNAVVYTVTAQSGDQRQWTVTVTVTPNQAPGITSSGTVSVAENQTAAIDVAATDDSDSEGSGLTYSLTTNNNGGVDNGLFDINADTGEVTFKSAPDFETPGDKDSGNDYEIQVTVTDGGGSKALQDITITVTDVDDTAPVIMLLGDNPMYLTVGDAYVEPGATATDDRDRDLSRDIVIGGNIVDTSVAGTYEVTYDVKDAVGNAADRKTRVVNVEEACPHIGPDCRQL